MRGMQRERLWPQCIRLQVSLRVSHFEAQHINSIMLRQELHQLSSPGTADVFLDDLLHSAERLETTVSDTSEFGNYVFRSWAGIIRSLGVI